MTTITSMTPEATQQQGSQPASMSIGDLQNLLIVLDLATTRGAFRGPELSQVGQVFDKLNEFLKSVTPPQDNTPQPVQQPTPQPVQAQSMPPTPTQVMPMTPAFTPKVGV